MKKRLLLSALLTAGVVFSTAQSSFAVDQIISASLASTASITVLAGQTTTTVMSPTDGALTAALTPGYTVVTNSPATLSFGGHVESTTGNVPCLSEVGGTYYMALANGGTNIPLAASVTNALQTTPTADGSPNVVSYALTGVPSNGTGMGVFTWNTDHFESTIATGASSNTILTTTQVARADTFSLLNDQTGVYQATLQLTFL